MPSGPTATAGSQAFTFEPTEPGTEIGVPKVAPPSVERAFLGGLMSLFARVLERRLPKRR